MVMRWTGASERAVKNWLAGENGPQGHYLIKILRHSNATLEAVLAASRRKHLLEFLIQTTGAPADGDRGMRKEPNHPGGSGKARIQDDNDPDGDPIVDPVDDPDLNKRQRWFLTAVIEGRRVSARAIKNEFGVSEKTAKRDIAGLKARSLLQFVGTRRRGSYKVMPGASRWSKSSRGAS
jgi:hypothetical protein